MASSDEYQQQRSSKDEAINWIKIGCNNAIVTKLDNCTVTWIPMPIMEPELVERGKRYFNNLKPNIYERKSN